MNLPKAKTPQISRGLRYLAMPPGLSVANGRLSLIEGDACIQQALVTLLFTRPGERVMRPRYGCDLDALAFAPMGPTTFMLAKLIVRRAIEQFEPRVAIKMIEVVEDPNAPFHLVVTLTYVVRSGGATNQLQFSIPTQLIDEDEKVTTP